MALTGSYDLIPDRQSALGPKPTTMTGGTARGFEPRPGLQEYEVQGEMQQTRQIQRLGRRAYRDALRDKNPLAGLKAIQGMRELGVRPQAGIEPAGAMEAGIRQRGNWVHGQMNAVQGGPLSTQQGPQTPEPGQRTMGMNNGTQVAPTTTPNGPGAPPAAGAPATGDPLAKRQALFSRMKEVSAKGGDPNTLRAEAIQSGTVADDASFDIGLNTLKRSQDAAKTGPLQAKQFTSYGTGSVGYTPEEQAAKSGQARPGFIDGMPAGGILDTMRGNETPVPEFGGRAKPVDVVKEFEQSHASYQNGLNPDNFRRMEEYRKGATPEQLRRMDAIATGGGDPGPPVPIHQEGTYKGSNPGILQNYFNAQRDYQTGLGGAAPAGDAKRALSRADSAYNQANSIDQARIHAANLAREGDRLRAEEAKKKKKKKR